jgi:hypothetical protein
MTYKGRERKRSWPGGTWENHENSQSVIRCLGRYLNPGLPECDVGMLTTTRIAPFSTLLVNNEVGKIRKETVVR